MARKLIILPRFDKDVKRCVRRGYNIGELKSIVDKLLNGENLPASCRPHKLSGSYAGCWECHIRPDWLLVWKQEDENTTLIMTRTGTHSDLFG